jgi:poly(3-hydroxybutyrate) depolymerase
MRTLMGALFLALCPLFPAWSAVEVTTGSGQFALDVVKQHGLPAHQVEVHYYRARSHRSDSPIIIVLPGGGRNGHDYRDSWTELAERYRLLVLSPSFSEEHYPGPLNYNLARMIKAADRANLDDLEVQSDPAVWIYGQIDRVFEAAARAVGSTRASYDIFGHSAGGQIVHRLVLFAPAARIDRAVAANSGWYTAATPQARFPFGLAGAPASDAQIRTAFGRNLTVLLGELDNADETRGHLRKTPETEAQGAHRLARGRYFYETARAHAKNLRAPFAWNMVVVPGVGHSYRQMSAAAAACLYEGH